MPFPSSSRLLVSLVAAIGLLGTAAHAIKTKADQLQQRLVPTVLAHLQERLQRKILVGAYDISQPGRISLNSVRVLDGKRAQDPPVASCSRIVLDYDRSLLGWVRLLRSGFRPAGKAVVEISDLHLTPPAALSNEAVFTARGLKANLDLGMLTSGQDPLAGVGAVLVSGATVRLERSAAGRWSYLDYLPKDTQTPFRFRGNLIGEQVEVLVVDHSPGSLDIPQRSRIRGGLRIDFAEYPTIWTKWEGRATGAANARIGVHGFLDARGRPGLLTFRADTPDAAYWYRYLELRVPGLKLDGARATVSGSIWSKRAPDDRLDFQTTIELEGGRGSLDAARLADVRGRVEIDPREARIVLEGAAAGTRLAVKGVFALADSSSCTLSIQTGPASLASLRQAMPRLRLPTDLPNVEWSRGDLQLTGQGDAWWIEASGATSAVRLGTLAGETASLILPHLEFRAQIARGRLSGAEGTVRAATLHAGAHRLENPWARFRVSGARLEFTAQGVGPPGDADATGWVEFGPSGLKAAHIAGALDHLVLPYGPLPATQKLEGQARFDYTLDLQDGTPRLRGTAETTGLRVGPEDVLAGRLDFTWTPGADVILSNAKFELPAGRVTGSGSIGPRGDLSIHARTRGTDLATLLCGRTSAIVRGSVNADVEVRGTWEKPDVSGELHLLTPAFQSHEADYATCTFHIGESRDVQLFDVNLVRAPLVFTAEEVVFAPVQGNEGVAETEVGETGGSGVPRWRMDGECVLRGGSLAQLLELAGQSEMLGPQPMAADLQAMIVRVHGPLDKLAVSGRFELTDCAFRGVDLGTARGEMRVSDGGRLVEVRDLEVAAPNLQLSGSARLWPRVGQPAESRIDLQLAARNTRLRPVVRRLWPSALDWADFNADLRTAEISLDGVLAAPRLRARAELARLVVNQRAIRISPFRVDWTPSALALGSLELEVRSGRVVIPNLVLELSREPETGARTLIHRAYGSVQIEKIPIDVIRQLIEDSPAFGSPKGAGLREWLAKLKSPLHGDISLLLSRGRDPKLAPEAGADQLLAGWRAGGAELPVTASAAIADLSLGEGVSPITTQFAGAGEWDGKVLKITQVVGRGSTGALFNASGSISQLRPGAAPALAGKFEASNVPLESVDRLPFNGVAEQMRALQPLEGRAELHGELSGNSESPLLRMRARVVRPVLAGIPFDELACEDARFSPAVGFQFREFRLSKAAPGEGAVLLHATGTMPVRWPALDLDPNRVRAVDLELPVQSVGRFRRLADDVTRRERESGRRIQPGVRSLISLLQRFAETEGRIEAHVKLGGTAARPSNSGAIRFRQGALKVAGFETFLRDIEGTLVLDGDLLRLEGVRGHSNTAGTLRADGAVTLGLAGAAASPRFDVTVSVDSVRFLERNPAAFLGASYKGSRLGGVLTTVDPARPRAAAPLQIVGTWPDLTVSGAMRLDDSTIAVAYAPVSAVSRLPEPSDIRLALRLFAGRNVRVQSVGVGIQAPLVRLPVQGSLQVSEAVTTPKIAGELQVADGSFSLLGLRLRNGTGTLRVNWDARLPASGSFTGQPLAVDLTASTVMSLQRSPAVEAEYYDVSFRLRGAPGVERVPEFRQVGPVNGLELLGQEGLHLAVRTDPPLPGAQIAALIRQRYGVEGFAPGGANVEEAPRSQVQQAFAVNVASTVTGAIEDRIQSMLRLEILSIELGVAEPVRIRLGKRLFDRIYGTVTQQFGPAPGVRRRLEFYYRFSPSLRVGVRNEQPLSQNVLFFSGTYAF